MKHDADISKQEHTAEDYTAWKKKGFPRVLNRGVKIFVLSLYINFLPEGQAEEPFFPLKGTQSDGQCEELKITLY